MRRSILRAAVLVSFVMGRASAQEYDAGHHVWKSYTNLRFQYAICYPEDLIIPQGKSANNDGQNFLAKDGARLIVFGQNNALSNSLEDALADTNRGSQERRARLRTRF